MTHKSEKLNREERIRYLKNALNVIRNLRYAKFNKPNDRREENVVFDSSLEQPIYSWWDILWDIVIGLNLRK
jgi:hypothetical protein